MSKRLVPLHISTFYPTGKTILLEKRDDGWFNTTFTNNYTWQTPVKEIFNPERVVTNTVMLPVGLQEAIKNISKNTWEEHQPFLPDVVSMIRLDTDDDEAPVFIVDVERWDFGIGGQCDVIFGKTGENYSEIGHVRKGFSELALHEKINGRPPIELCYSLTPSHWEYYGVRNNTYLRELYVFDGKQYNLAVRSWLKNDTEGQEDVAQVFPSNREGEEKLETRSEELEAEKPNETNSLWLFAGIIFCLYAVCHFLRKKSPKNQKMKP